MDEVSPSGVNSVVPGTATTRKGACRDDRSCTPMDARLRPRPRAKWSFSWWSIKDLMNSSISSSPPWISTPLTIAPRMTGRISDKRESTATVMPLSLTFMSGVASVPWRKGRSACVSVSPLSKSGRSGNISISNVSSSHRSMSVPINGNWSPITSTSCVKPCWLSR